MLYFITALVVVLLILFLLLLFTWKNGTSPTPTPTQVRSALFSHLPEIKKGTIVELGSGWGNLIFPLSKKYSDCRIIGYENSPIPFLCSVLLNYQSNLKIIRRDFFNESLQGVDLVICYLFPKGMEKLRKKLEAELAVGTKVVSHTHPIPKWEAKEIIEVAGPDHSAIFIYEIT